MKSRIKKLWKYLATAVLGLLGFSSCGEGGLDLDTKEVLAMYGAPYADFKSLGTVKDEAGKPVEGIRAAISQTWRNSDDSICWIEADTVYTDTKGSYLLEKNRIRLPGELKIVFEDIDGAKNGGEFKSAEVTPDVKKTSEGDKGWYQGVYEAQADIVLHKK
ncbi:MAG: radical SAM-associated putative lipoprotein [Bacteroidales bacterium]|nr:radical SAM-associated putative lipoprotein [Bacteroidales bacterium]